MTQEEKKAKAYDEALEKARKLYERGTITESLSHVFPELKESEDERIRKFLIEDIKDTLSSEDFKYYNQEHTKKLEEALAWLEKHGEDKEINNFDVLPGLYKCVHRMFDGTPDSKLLFEVGNVYKCLSKHDRAEFEVSYGHSVYLEDPVVCKHFIPFEKQGEQKPVVIIPKFRIGDNIKTTNEEPLTITKIDGKGYWSEDLFICGFDAAAKWELVEQKSAWSEDDNKWIESLIQIFEDGYFEGFNQLKSYGVIDWLNKKMFDYRGLIERGLAIAVTEDNNPYKE